jgi:hypothetical protein
MRTNLQCRHPSSMPRVGLRWRSGAALKPVRLRSKATGATVTAVRFDGTPNSAIAIWAWGKAVPYNASGCPPITKTDGPDPRLFVRSVDGIMPAGVGDGVIRCQDGDHLRCLSDDEIWTVYTLASNPEAVPAVFALDPVEAKAEPPAKPVILVTGAGCRMCGSAAVLPYSPLCDACYESILRRLPGTRIVEVGKALGAGLPRTM